MLLRPWAGGAHSAPQTPQLDLGKRQGREGIGKGGEGKERKAEGQTEREKEWEERVGKRRGTGVVTIDALR